MFNIHKIFQVQTAACWRTAFWFFQSQRDRITKSIAFMKIYTVVVRLLLAKRSMQILMLFLVRESIVVLFWTNKQNRLFFLEAKQLDELAVLWCMRACLLKELHRDAEGQFSVSLFCFVLLIWHGSGGVVWAIGVAREERSRRRRAIRVSLRTVWLGITQISTSMCYCVVVVVVIIDFDNFFTLGQIRWGAGVAWSSEQIFRFQFRVSIVLAVPFAEESNRSKDKRCRRWCWSRMK